MTPHRSMNRTVSAAGLLGLTTLLTNGVIHLLLEAEQRFPLGDLFLFIAAGALGVPGALAALAIGHLPGALWQGEWFELMRMAAVLSTIGWATTRFPRVPMFCISAGLWALLAGVMEVAGVAPSIAGAKEVVFVALRELIFTLAAGTILLNDPVWHRLARRPRHASPALLFVHVVPLVAVTAMWLGISFTASIGGFDSPHTLIRWGLVAALCGVVMPALWAWRCAAHLTRDSSVWGRSSVLPVATGGFSGLASDFWRRREASPSALSLRTSAPAADMLPDGLESNTEAICALNPDGTITLANPRFVEVTGIRMHEIAGRKINAVGLDPELVRQLEALVERTCRRGACSSEVKLNKLPASLRFLELSSLRPEEPDSGQSLGSVIITVRDITDRRTVEAHLLQAQKADSLGSVVAGIAHAFNNTLTTIIGQASFARHGATEALRDTSLDEILRAGRHGGELVRQLLDFSAQGLSPMQRGDLGTIVGERIDLLTRMVGEGCEIRWQAPTVPCGVSCDPNLIMQALTNLALNARDAYGDRGGPIAVTIDTERLDEEVSDFIAGARPGTFVRLRVHDAGVGMTPEVLARAFDPLFTTRGGSGHSGLGLSTVYAITRAHDGFLTAESHPGRGTTVTLYLPLEHLGSAEVDASVADRESSPLVALRGSNERILLVEDEAQVRELVARMLTSLGYQVASCANGEEALQECARGSFDLVLLDLVLPRLSGGELISRIRESGDHTRALIMTGYGAAHDPVPGTKLLPKPFDLPTLGRAVRDALRAS